MDYDGEEDVALEDVLNALLVRLVDPLLHNLNPAVKLLSKEEDIAYQMEALAWLYNHFIRQSFPHLLFLDSPSLCRKAVIQRANLAGYLSLQNGGQTLTELRVSEACDAAGSQNSPKAKNRSCRVSRVAALILSPCRQKCVLVQSLVTKSVWSFVEEDIGHGRKVRDKEDSRYELCAESMKKKSKVANSKKLISTEDELTDGALMKLVLSAVADQTGIEQAALKVEDEYLEAQCMSQGTASTRLYILVCSSLYDIKAAPHLEKATWVAVDEVVSRAAGPLVETSGWGVYPASAIDYFHLRPFCALLQNKLSQSCFENGSCTKIQKPLTSGLDSGSKPVLPKEKSVEDPSCTIIILEDQDTDCTGKEDSPGSFTGTKGERKDSNQTTLTTNGSNTTASTSEYCIEPKARPQDDNTKGRKKYRKVVGTRNAGRESPKKIVIAVGSGSECIQDGNEGSQRIDRLQDNSPGHATNPCKGKQDNKATAAKVEQSANSSSEVDVEGMMMTKVAENNKDESKGVQGSKPSGGSCPEVSYIRPKASYLH
ncbi:hypothetical protein O6H91_04G055400 [Diphasiastrum complanatum]|uniref:Uncharacterized protein n=1 Tax=Diphasiastrum complanatum TaxID=34168 RepID=A0ACC2DWZ7_DIPCM|nr:hypothetical protein O6H91_04G055400 [Diphasiastrum complanatum]